MSEEVKDGDNGEGAKEFDASAFTGSGIVDSADADDNSGESKDDSNVDGNSNDDTVAKAQEFEQNFLHFKILHNPSLLSSAGWNLGIEKSQGEVVSFLSGHVDFETDYYRKLVKRLDRDICGVGGPSFTKGKGLKGKIISLAYLSVFGSGGASFLSDSKEGFVESIVFGCYWKKDIQRMES